MSAITRDDANPTSANSCQLQRRLFTEDVVNVDRGRLPDLDLTRYRNRQRHRDRRPTPAMPGRLHLHGDVVDTASPGTAPWAWTSPMRPTTSMDLFGNALNTTPDHGRGVHHQQQRYPPPPSPGMTQTRPTPTSVSFSVDFSDKDVVQRGRHGLRPTEPDRHRHGQHDRGHR